MHQLFLIFLNPNFSKALGFESISFLIFFDRFLGFDLRYGSISDSLYSKSVYFFQLLPCLEFTYALRKAFGVLVGVGRILNADEVMKYRYDPSSRSWHV